MNSVETLHSVAMDYSELGQIAKLKGKKAIAKEYMEKAYVVAIETALRCQIELKERDPLKATYLRSVSWLAFKVNKYQEAYHWANLALSIVPNEYEKESLNKLLSKISQKIQGDSLERALKGIITAFNIYEKNISLDQGDQKIPTKIVLTNPFYNSILPFYIGKSVEIEVDKGHQNQLILKNIRPAA